MTIPTQITESQFQKYFEPSLSKAKRGYVSKIPLFKIFNYILYVVHTGCQWKSLPIETSVHTTRKELSYQAVYHRFRKWSRDGSWKTVFDHSIQAIKDDVNLSEIHLDGTHTIGKKGGVSVQYQGRKKAKTSNIIPVTDAHGFIIATTKILPGNRNDLNDFDTTLRHIFSDLKHAGFQHRLNGSYLNADAGFDTKTARKICFNHCVIPNIPENIRNRTNTKRGRKRFFNVDVYKHRFTIERSFAWADKFKRVLIRFEKIDVFFFAVNLLAFTMINLRFLLNAKV